MARRVRRRKFARRKAQQAPVDRVKEAGYSIPNCGTENVSKMIPPLEKVRRPSDQAAWVRQERLINEYFEEGNLLFDKENFKFALEKYEAVTDLAPDYAEAYYNSGMCYRSLGDDKEALQAFLKCVRSKQNWTEAWEFISTILTKMNKLTEAEEACCKAISSNKDKSWKNYERLGMILWKKDQKDFAVQVFHECIDIENISSLAHYHLGLYYFKKDDLEDSRSHLNSAVKISPKYKEAWYALGKTICLLGNIKKAQQVFGKVLNIDPEHTEAEQWLDFTERVDSCLQDYVKEIHPEYSIPDTSEDAYLQLGLKLLDEAKYSQAIDILSEGHQEYPNSIDMSLWFGISYAVSLRYSTANQIWQEIFDVIPENQKSRILLCIGHSMICKKIQANWFLKEIEDSALVEPLKKLIDMIPLRSEEHPES